MEGRERALDLYLGPYISSGMRASHVTLGNLFDISEAQFPDF